MDDAAPGALDWKPTVAAIADRYSGHIGIEYVVHDEHRVRERLAAAMKILNV